MVPQVPKITVFSYIISPQMQNNQINKDVDVYSNVPDWLCTYSTRNNFVNGTIQTTGLQFTGHLSHRGRRQRASPLRFAAPPQGLQGVLDFQCRICIKCMSQGPRPLTPAPPKSLPKVIIFQASISAPPFFKQNLQNMRKLSPKGTPFGG